MPQKTDPIQLSERDLYLFKSLVEHFIYDGQPVGSRTLARDTVLELSPATIRNVMADLEDAGLLHSPHTSAGRIPTAKGYRLFVDTLLRVNQLDSNEVEDTLNALISYLLSHNIEIASRRSLIASAGISARKPRCPRFIPSRGISLLQTM